VVFRLLATISKTALLKRLNEVRKRHKDNEVRLALKDSPITNLITARTGGACMYALEAIKGWGSHLRT
jgi:hypothetical protein